MLRGVLRWNPFVPVLLGSILFIRSPHVGPEANRLRSRRVALDDDADCGGRGDELTSAHVAILIRGDSGDARAKGTRRATPGALPSG